MLVKIILRLVLIIFETCLSSIQISNKRSLDLYMEKIKWRDNGYPNVCIVWFPDVGVDPEEVY